MSASFAPIYQDLGLPPEREGEVWKFARFERPLAFHHHAELEMNLVVSGRATYMLDDRRYALREETQVWLFPAQNHILLERSPDFAMWILVVRPELVERVCAADSARILRESNPVGLFSKRLPPRVSGRLGALFEELIGAREDVPRYNAGLAYALLSAWSAYLTAEEPGESQRVHPAVEQAARLLREEAEPTSLKQLAAQFDLSASRLSALFKEQTGVPLARFRNQQRLERFLRLYREAEGRKTLLEAALESGFGSYAQFYRVFRAAMRLSPAEFQVRGEREPER